MIKNIILLKMQVRSLCEKAKEILMQESNVKVCIVVYFRLVFPKSIKDKLKCIDLYSIEVKLNATIICLEFFIQTSLISASLYLIEKVSLLIIFNCCLSSLYFKQCWREDDIKSDCAAKCNVGSVNEPADSLFCLV